MKEEDPVKEQKDSEPKETSVQKPDFLDYIALTIALLQTTLLPVVLIFIALIIVFLTFITITSAGPQWLVVLYAPIIALPPLLRRYTRWRRIQKARASLR